MLGFPPSTEFNKRIPKQKFYENAAGSQAIVCRPAALYLLAQQAGGVHLESHCRRAGDRDRDFRAVSDRAKTG